MKVHKSTNPRRVCTHGTMHASHGNWSYGIRHLTAHLQLSDSSVGDSLHSWLTMLCSYRLTAKWISHTRIYPLPFRFCSDIGHPVPCSKSLLAIILYSVVCMYQSLKNFSSVSNPRILMLHFWGTSNFSPMLHLLYHHNYTFGCFLPLKIVFFHSFLFHSKVYL